MPLVAGYYPTPYVVHHLAHRRCNYYLPKKISQKSQILEQSVSRSLSSCLSASIIFTLESCPFLLRLQISLHPIIILHPFSPIISLILEEKFLSHPTVCKVDTQHTGADEGLGPRAFSPLSSVSSSAPQLCLSIVLLLFSSPDGQSSTFKISIAFTNTYKLAAHFL